MVNNRTFELRPISELMAILRNDFRELDDERYIDEGRLIKVIMACNDRLGLKVREIKQVCIPVDNYKAQLPMNFEKLYYAAALSATGSIVHNMVNPFNNSFDRDIIYEAELDRDSLGCKDCYSVTIKRGETTTVHNYGSWHTLQVGPSSLPYCHIDCPNKRGGKYMVEIDGDSLRTPFRTGEIYIMYVANMCDENGNLLFPFHPLITPYYEWSLKEKVLMDCIFNSNENYGEKLKFAQAERVKAWLDAHQTVHTEGFREAKERQRRKELEWYSQYFRFFQ